VHFFDINLSAFDGCPGVAKNPIERVLAVIDVRRKPCPSVWLWFWPLTSSNPVLADVEHAMHRKVMAELKVGLKRLRHVELYAASQLHLRGMFGFANTVILLVSLDAARLVTGSESSVAEFYAAKFHEST